MGLIYGLHPFGWTVEPWFIGQSAGAALLRIEGLIGGVARRVAPSKNPQSIAAARRTSSWRRSMMFSSRERNRSSIPDGALRDGFMTGSDPHRSEPENHVPEPKEIPKILFLNLQAFQAKSPKSCRTSYFKTPKPSAKSTHCRFFTRDYSARLFCPGDLNGSTQHFVL